MFANLKNKIFEEVKASPQKFQQFAQAAQAAVSSTSSNASDSVSGSDNFFSITEEDTPQNSPLRLPSSSKKVSPQQSNATSNAAAVSFANNGVTINRTRKLSNSSMASDVSFRLPAYDSPAVYHLQSDLDISASEVEDSAGASAAHLDVISKEHLHSAYKKALDRYQKYRARYTDLAKRYRDLERDSTKARAVLVETQDKAIRRISELREQCSLEQQAKAHLEEALRMEMDDMQCKIKAYQTKLKLMGENPDAIVPQTETTKTEESLIQLDTEEDTNLIRLDADKDKPNDTATLNNDVQLLNVKIVKLEELLAKYKQQLSETSSNLSEKTKEVEELQYKLTSSEEVNSNLKKREEENVILLAENKLMVHTELENKEREVKQLKQKIIELETSFKQAEKQATDEHTLEELQNRIVEKEKAIENLKKSFDEQIKANAFEYEQKLTQNNEKIAENLKKEEQDKQSLQNKISELEKQRTKMEQNHAIVDKELTELKSLLSADKENIEKLATENSNLKTEASKLKNQLNQSKTHNTACKNEIKELKAEIESMRIVAQSTESEAVKNLQDSIHEANKKSEEKLNALKEEITEKTNECNVHQEKIEELTRELETAKSQESILQGECQNLKVKLDEVTNDRDDREIQMEKERTELKSQVTNILQEISRMEGEMKGVKKSHADLEEEKRLLEKKIEKLTKQNQVNQEGSQKWQALIREAEEKIHQLETKLQTVESENSQLAEKNCLLTENQNRLEIQIKESENNNKKEKSSLNGMIKEAEINFSALRLENETANDTIKKLNEKMSQVLDENSRLHNAKELMEHEFRSLQDQCESREKEKLCVLDNNKCMEEQLQRLRDENERLKEQSSSQSEKEQYETLLSEVRELKDNKENLEKEIENLRKEVAESGAVKEENSKLKADIEKLENMCKELGEKSEESKAKIIVAEENQLKLSTQVSTLESTIHELEEKLKAANKENSTIKEQNESFSKEIHMLNTQNQTRLSELENLLKRTNDEKQTLKESIKNATDLEKKLQNYEEQKIENEYLNTLTNQLETDIRKLNEEKAKAEAEINELKEKVKSLQCEMYVHVENKEKHDAEINEITQKLTAAQEEIEKVKSELANEREEAKQQKDHSLFITEQNDCLQKELLLWQQKLNEAEKLCGETRVSYEEILNENSRIKEEIKTTEEKLKQENANLSEENEKDKSVIIELTKDLKQATILLNTLQKAETENVELRDKLQALEIELTEKVKLKNESNLEASRTNQSDMENLRKINETLQKELEDMKHKTSSQISDLTQEVDDLTVTARQMSEKIGEYENLKIRHAQLDAEIDSLRQDANANINTETDALMALRREKEDLEDKLQKIMHEVQDVSNRNLFLEQKCENYLILEQSNERLKLANDKLSRQLDETLVSMQHSEGISANTEFEYLRNIMFQYLTGHLSGNNSTLVKVIAAVLKFSPQQTQVAIEKEHQRHTVLGQINNLL